MVVRKVIEIDRDKCNGCRQCVDACHEGAIQMVNGKAELVSDVYCDGLGDCIGECPVDAIRMIEREAEPFDEAAVKKRQAQKTAAEPLPCGCPGAALKSFAAASKGDKQQIGASTLTNWPVQLSLLPIEAPFFTAAHLLLAADCVPFAWPAFHQEMLSGKKLVIGCPKLDNTMAYKEKLTEILRRNEIKELSVVFMEVPCCMGLVNLAREALQASGKEIKCNLHRVTIQGDCQDFPVSS